MLRKRIIFTLLYNDGNFSLSRNFRLQNVGDIEWLLKNYDFKKVSNSIDELIILDVSRVKTPKKTFLKAIERISSGIFVPISGGGGIANTEDVSLLLNSGCDKVVINSLIFELPEMLKEISVKFGEQSIIASLDLKKNRSGHFEIWANAGARLVKENAKIWFESISTLPVGEIYVNSIDQDGTGQGFDLDILNLLPSNAGKPIILAGGAGNARHLKDGLINPKVDAVATANLLNFIGDGLYRARLELMLNGISLPQWDTFNHHDQIGNSCINE